MAEESSTPSRQHRFGVYQNAAIASALDAQGSRRSSPPAIVALVFLVSTWGLLSISYRKETIKDTMRLFGLTYLFAKTTVRLCQVVLTLVFLGALSAFLKAIFSSEEGYFVFKSSSQISSPLTPRQEMLLGRRSSRTALPPPKTAKSPTAVSPSTMFPIHPPLFKGGVKGSGQALGAASPATPVQVSTFPYTPSVASSPDSSFLPWTLKYRNDEIRTEEELESFLSDVGTRMVESSGRSGSTPQGGPVTPSPIRVLGAGSGPNVMSTTPRSPATAGTPVRAVRVSPSSQKSGVSPKKAEGDLPAPFTIEQATDGFKKLGLWPDIDQWRDGLRQWFSDVLLAPLLYKIDRSHLQVMETAATLSFSLAISPIEGKRNSNSSPGMDGSAQEWLTTFAPDEDALIHQFRAYLLNAKSSTPTPSIFGLKVPNEQDVNPLLQACLDAVTEHQRLRALVKGEWVKGLLPQSSVRSDYTVQRLRELAEGTCVRKYEFAGTGEVYDKSTKRWSLELPTDAHLLVYLFCALLEHPQWMLHVDPTSHPSTQSGNNPLFIASLPQKERFPDKYVAVLSSAPPVLHAGACILAVGKQSPPVFALYWDKKLQFSLQGRTALWDAILLLCHRIKVAHGGIVRGINLGGPAFNLLSLLEQPCGEN
ncbi:transmembrane protein 209 [Selaginella moellendorffii]|uniref:transmembrane protein 209 n=1 Tax=Selaginella moellendorffii TaxID=88036 RepID=UPI000D1CFAFA|nr:transmembrane protein 209 [Selaginella moellendorffii]|eukprot:XP_024525884.1 transmembrane protein 209 [Selaginella moellendorffii]